MTRRIGGQPGVGVAPDDEEVGVLSSVTENLGDRTSDQTAVHRHIWEVITQSGQRLSHQQAGTV